MLPSNLYTCLLTLSTDYRQDQEHQALVDLASVILDKKRVRVYLGLIMRQMVGLTGEPDLGMLSGKYVVVGSITV